MRTTILAATIAAAMSAAPTAGLAASYAIGWTGANGYTMTGHFSFDDSLLGTTIESDELDALSIEIFQNGVSQGTWDLFADGLQPGADPVNFNFDSAADEFRVGGDSTSTSGQVWNTNGNFLGCGSGYVGFISGSFSQGPCVDGSGPSGSRIFTSDSTLTATRKPDVIPLPAPALLMLGGLGALAAFRRRGSTGGCQGARCRENSGRFACREPAYLQQKDGEAIRLWSSPARPRQS